MTLCPVAIAVGCKRCPVYKLCLVKSLLGDVQRPAKPASAGQAVKPPPAAKQRAPAKRTRQRTQPGAAAQD